MAKEYDSLASDPQHHLFSPHWDATYFCLIVLIAMMLYQFSTDRSVRKQLEKWFNLQPFSEFAFDEKLGNFWSNLSAYD
jgi:hypothetical protein